MNIGCWNLQVRIHLEKVIWGGTCRKKYNAPRFDGGQNVLLDMRIIRLLSVYKFEYSAIFWPTMLRKKYEQVVNIFWSGCDASCRELDRVIKYVNTVERYYYDISTRNLMYLERGIQTFKQSCRNYLFTSPEAVTGWKKFEGFLQHEDSAQTSLHLCILCLRLPARLSTRRIDQFII